MKQLSIKPSCGLLVHSLLLVTCNVLMGSQDWDISALLIDPFLTQNHFEVQKTEPLLQQVNQENRKNPLAIAFSTKHHGHVAMSFSDGCVEIRNSKNTNNLLHSILCPDPISFIGFGIWDDIWKDREDLILEQGSCDPSTLRFFNIQKQESGSVIDIIESPAQIGNLPGTIRNMIFDPKRVLFQIFDRQNNMITFGIKASSTNTWEKLSTMYGSDSHVIFSPIKNYVAFFENYRTWISPIIDGTTSEATPITIDTDELIEDLKFSLNGKVLTIITTFNEKKPNKKRVSLYESLTGKLITKLNIAHPKEIKSISLNEDASQIAVLYNNDEQNNERQAQLITFDNHASYKLNELAVTNNVLKDLLINAIKNKQQAEKKRRWFSPYYLPWDQYSAYDTLTPAQQAFLAKKLLVKMTWMQSLHQFIKSPSGIATTCVLALYLWWKNSY